MKIFCKNFLLNLIIIFFTFSTPIFALSPEKKLVNQELENRAMNLFLVVRCLVCNGQVIENSDTKFAYDMRELIRNQIKEGKSDQEIKKYLVKNFGADILNEPSKIGFILFVTVPLIIATYLLIYFFKQLISKNDLIKNEN